MIDLGDLPYPNNRLREAREYLGFGLREVAAFLGTYEKRISFYEDGVGWPSKTVEERLSELYRRPIGWLRGDPEEPVEISPEMDDLLQRIDLSPNDRAEVLNVIAFLHDRAVTKGPNP